MKFLTRLIYIVKITNALISLYDLMQGARISEEKITLIKEGSKFSAKMGRVIPKHDQTCYYAYVNSFEYSDITPVAIYLLENVMNSV